MPGIILVILGSVLLTLLSGCTAGEALPTLQLNPVVENVSTLTPPSLVITLAPTLTEAPVIDLATSALVISTELPPTTLELVFPNDHACMLLSSADAELILGHPVKPPEIPLDSGGTRDVSSCKYYVDIEDSFESAQLVLMKFDSPELAQADFDLVRGEARATFQTPVVDVLGLGDQAFWVAGEYQTLFVLSGPFQLQFSASGQVGDQAPEGVVILIQAILDRLPE